MPRKVAILALTNTRMTGLGAVLDLCELANRYTAQLFAAQAGPSAAMQVQIVTPDGGPVRLSGGRTMRADGAIDTEIGFDAVYVAAFEAGDPAAFAQRLAHSSGICAWLAAQRAHGAVIAAAGEAAALLAHAHLLEGGEAAAPAHWLAFLSRRRPGVRFDAADGVVHWQGLLTAAGPGLEAALAARLLQEAFSQNLGDHLRRVCKIVDDTLFEAAPTSEDEAVQRAQLWLQRRFAQKVTIPELAEAVGLSQKALTRRFRSSLDLTPQSYLQYLRMEAAKRQLLHTKRRIDRIAGLVGYGDVGFFKEKFRDHTGMTPAAFREAARRR
jgi:transcriptional regulator GlxA family with amidase domain